MNQILAELFSELGNIFETGLTIWSDWHNTSGVNPTKLALEASEIVSGLASTVETGEDAYQEIKSQLSAKHPSLPIMQVRTLAASAAQHFEVSRKKR